MRQTGDFRGPSGSSPQEQFPTFFSGGEGDFSQILASVVSPRDVDRRRLPPDQERSWMGDSGFRHPPPTSSSTQPFLVHPHGPVYRRDVQQEIPQGFSPVSMDSFVREMPYDRLPDGYDFRRREAEVRRFYEGEGFNREVQTHAFGHFPTSHSPDYPPMPQPPLVPTRDPRSNSFSDEHRSPPFSDASPTIRAASGSFDTHSKKDLVIHFDEDEEERLLKILRGDSDAHREAGAPISPLSTSPLSGEEHQRLAFDIDQLLGEKKPEVEPLSVLNLAVPDLVLTPVINQAEFVNEEAVVTEPTEQEVKPPEVKQPEVKPSKVKQPEVKPSKVKQPEVKPPEVKQPEVKPPEVKQPEVKPPKVKPEVKPSKVKPEVKPTKVKQPEASSAKLSEGQPTSKVRRSSPKPPIAKTVPAKTVSKSKARAKLSPNKVAQSHPKPPLSGGSRGGPRNGGGKKSRTRSRRLSSQSCDSESGEADEELHRLMGETASIVSGTSTVTTPSKPMPPSTPMSQLLVERWSEYVRDKLLQGVPSEFAKPRKDRGSLIRMRDRKMAVVYPNAELEEAKASKLPVWWTVTLIALFAWFPAGVQVTSWSIAFFLTLFGWALFGCFQICRLAWRVHLLALSALILNLYTPLSFGLACSVPYVVRHHISWLPCWLTASIWYIYLAAVLFRRGPILFRAICWSTLPLLFLMEGVDRLSVFMTLPGSVRILVGYSLSCFHSDFLRNPISLIVFGIESILCYTMEDSWSLRWILLVGGLASLRLMRNFSASWQACQTIMTNCCKRAVHSHLSEKLSLEFPRQFVDSSGKVHDLGDALCNEQFIQDLLQECTSPADGEEPCDNPQISALSKLLQLVAEKQLQLAAGELEIAADLPEETGFLNDSYWLEQAESTLEDD